MPIEDEEKFVIIPRTGQYDPTHARLTEIGSSMLISQFYVDGVRIRSVLFEATGDQQCLFTWKKSLPNGSLMEIETEISMEDRDLLLPLSNKAIRKRRNPILRTDIASWDMDEFMDDHDRPWLIMVEAEGGQCPTSNEVARAVQNLNLLSGNYSVVMIEKSDRRFDNARLAVEDGRWEALSFIRDYHQSIYDMTVSSQDHHESSFTHTPG